MAAAITEKKFALMHLVPLVVKVEELETNDWVVLQGYKGVIPLYGMGQSIAASLQNLPIWGAATINNGGTAYSTTSTSIVVSTAHITRVPPYYVITAGGEILEVLGETATDNAASTWTVRRGCLGTTASATGLANTNVVGIMNIVVCSANNVGPQTIVVLPLPNDAGTKPFA